ncbi:MAG: TrkH family potassium uptake protein [Candidatus Cloacimonetes bacterium]|nr:TrkH family potassium uptake protein [Candidatus Cloacimonadota bacterium]
MKNENEVLHRKVDYLLNRILYLLAFINFFILFFSVALSASLLYYYTASCEIIFVLYLIIHESRFEFSIQRFLLRSPDIFILLVSIFLHLPLSLFLFYLLGRQILVSIRNRSQGSLNEQSNSIIDHISTNPPVFFMISFILTISVGTMFLMLPAATAAGTETPFIDALFTATSATCVTGLIVQDTGTYFSLFGQLVILVLIQIGALGIMTISGAFFLMIGQKMKMRSENLIQNMVGESNKLDMMKLVKNIVLITVGIEFLGAILLYWRFSQDFGQSIHTLYIAVFHSISAFCNAGFSIFSDNLMRWYDDFSISMLIAVLIIIGGIGFPVIQEVFRIIKQKKRIVHLSLHAKIVIFTTIVLLLLGTLIFFISEYNNIMKDYTLPQRLLTSFFQSVTTRTAGFNTIDNAALSDSSILSSIWLMFVGASPGSTGGGLKTTAFFILFATVISMFKGRKDVTAFNRKIADIYMKRVIALVTASLSLLIIMIFFLMHFESAPFAEVMFEAFSAFGTVGLSMGITPHLTHSGKIIIILLMYLGRVGPLTLGFAISQNVKKTQFDLIEEKINIG